MCFVFTPSFRLISTQCTTIERVHGQRSLSSYFEEKGYSYFNCGHVVPSMICVNGRQADCHVKRTSFERCPKLDDGEVEDIDGILQILIRYCDSIVAKVFVCSLGGTTTGCEKILNRLCERFRHAKNVTIHSYAIQHAQFMRTNLPYRSPTRNIRDNDTSTKRII